MARRPWMTTGDGIARWLVPAAVLHAAFVTFAAAFVTRAGPSPDSAEPASRAAESEWSLDLTLLDDAGRPVVADFAPAAAVPPVAEPAPANEPLEAERVVVVVPRPEIARPAIEPSQPVAATSLEVAEGGTPALLGRDEPAAEPQRGSSPTLSLEQLGIGTNPFLGVAIQPLTKEERASARLHAALHPTSAERDRQRGLGPAGPVAAAARQLVLADDTLVETSAVLNVRVDGSGRVTEVQVLDASSQTKAWQMIAARLAQALVPVKLRADSPQGWGMKLRLASSVQLPSGAAPGMRVGVLGQQVAGSGDSGSTSLELSPTSKLDLREIEQDSIGRHMDEPVRFEVMLLKLRADPADLGAAARRVVEVAVLSIDAPTAP